MSEGDVLAGLRVTYKELTLHPANEGDIDALMLVYSGDFNFRSHARQVDRDPEAVRAGMVERVTRHIRPASPNSWFLDLAVESQPGVLLGWATLEATDYSRLRQVETTSWVKIPSRHQGHATSIRVAVLSLAFDSLLANVAISRVEPSNTYSSRISQKLGYEWAGFSHTDPADGPVITYDHWELRRQAWPTIGGRAVIYGAEPFRRWLDVGC